MKDAEKATQPRLAEADRAVFDYLDALLSEVETVPETEIVTETPVAVEVMAEVEAEQETVAAPPAIPAWAEEPFQCLLFKVRGMILAVPLLSLDSIVKWDSEIAQIPGQPDWHMGVMQHREQQVVVVDTAKLLMPERLKRASEERQGSHILVIGGRWGLAADSLAKPITLEKEGVHWTVAHPHRPWVAGTVVEKLCILLNVDALLDVFGHE